MAWRFAVRDVVVTALVVWAYLVERGATTQDGVVRFWLLTVGVGVGCALVGFLLHEWGHLLGSVWSGSVVHFSPRLTSVFLFHFDTRANDRRQFMWMSMGGYLASAIGLVAVGCAVSPERASGRIAIALVALGVLVTLVLEVPTTIRVWRGGALPDGAIFRPLR